MSAEQAGGKTYLKRSDAEQVFDRMTQADAKDLNRQITGMTILRTCGAVLGVVFLIVNSYQATWALMKLSGNASGDGVYRGVSNLTADQWIIGATAFGLIFAAQVIAVRMVMASNGWKVIGVALLIGLMAFSTITSAIHIGFSIQGGVVESVRQTDEYKLAKQRYETAIESKTTAERNWSLYQEDNRGGDPWSMNATHSQGPARPYVEGVDSAAAEVDAARRAFQEVKESGGGSAISDVVTSVAKWFGMETADFSIAFGVFVVILMEAARIYLSLLTGLYLMQVMNEIAETKRAEMDQKQGEATKDEPAKQPEPAKPSRVMASSATGATDSIKGPVLNDPIDVDDEPAKPRPMFAPKKPEPTVEQTPARDKSPKDTAPGGKRQAEFSKKLARLKQSIGPDREFKPGDKITGPRIKEIVGGNNETITALRNALVNDGLAHWKGKTVIAGGET